MQMLKVLKACITFRGMGKIFTKGHSPQYLLKAEKNV